MTRRRTSSGTDAAASSAGRGPEHGGRVRYGVAAVILVLIAAVLGVRFTVARPFSVPSSSMTPLLQEGDLIVADPDRHVDLGTDVRRGDVVVVDAAGYFDDGHSPSYYVKRVVAIGGDTVATDAEGHLVVNGTAVRETYIPADQRVSSIRFSLRVPEGRVFLLGDDRAASDDSRGHLGDPGGGMIPADRIVGRATAIVWPLGRAGSIARVSETADTTGEKD